MTGSGSDSKAAYYPIRVVSAETGINAITLRAWERRYGLIEPKRTAKGHRLYTEQDIQLIRRIVALLNRGIPISQAQAMIANGEADPEPAIISKPSQWQVYREQLAQACQQFGDRQLATIFDEVCQFFPVEMALRFLFIPFSKQLEEQRSQTLGSARISFYQSFLQARLAWRLSETGDEAESVRVLFINCCSDEDIDQLFIALLVRQLGLGVTRLAGLVAIDQTIQLLNDCRHWQLAVIRIESDPQPQRFEQLRRIAAETGLPIFVTGAMPDYHQQLKQQGTIPLPHDDYQSTALTIRDIAEGMPS
ncbi:MerR family transcriptional regulator [Oceanobacter mangrovi]|uniref:MerR family transcriptional regulator n=1 Tax=Oceanobacter mangrovi TaxID=2862510 RepID=UPI001C8D3454|nr:MerR family transcriptional regulator [Oceanobacter mangrovi]